MLACLLLAGCASYLTGPADGVGYLLAYQSVAGIGLGLTGWGAWRHRRSLGSVGILTSAAISCAFVGDARSAVDTRSAVHQLARQQIAFPSGTDLLYLAAYLAMTVAALLLVRRCQLGWSLADLIDATTVTVGIGTVAYVFVVADVIDDTRVSVLARAVGVLYPLCDVLLAGLVVRLLVGPDGRRPPVIFLTGAVACLLAADVVAAASLYRDPGSVQQTWNNPLYLLFYLLVGAALCHPDTAHLATRRSPEIERLGPGRSGLLAAGGLLAPITLLLASATGQDTHVREIASVAIVLFGLTLLRMVLLVRAVEAQSEQLSVLARTDGLTGLANRRTFDHEMQRAMATATATNSVLTVGLLDLDHFKRFNDTFGHGAGDQLLSRATAAWSSTLPSGVLLARYGGEEFALLFPAITAQIAAAVLQMLLESTPLGQTFSAGVGEWDGEQAPHKLMNRVDHLMYTAKRGGRARVVIVDDLNEENLLVGWNGLGDGDPRYDGPRRDDLEHHSPGNDGPRDDGRRNDGPRKDGPRKDDRRNDDLGQTGLGHAGPGTDGLGRDRLGPGGPGDDGLGGGGLIGGTSDRVPA